jgi:pilus assembly protein CpaE
MSLADLTGPQRKTDDAAEAPQYPEAKVSPRTHGSSDVILICPNEIHRRSLSRALGAQQASIVNQLSLYPAYNHLLTVLDQECDAFVIEIDTDTNAALELVETICARKPSTTVMVYSAAQQADLVMSSMRAGAREFLSGVIPSSVLNEALLRASSRRTESTDKRVRGKVLLFWGAKGGSGVTTLATNMAIALRQETGEEVALLDLHPHLGDVAVLLGITPRFTIAEALANPKRLDKEFVSTIMTRHGTGLSVLAAPDVYSSTPVESSSVGKLVDQLSAQFAYVVIDAGLSPAEGVPLFQMAGTIYVVAQTDIPSLRSTQRFVSYLQGYGAPNVELVLNRFEGRRVHFDDEQLTKTLGIAPKWKVPNDYAAARRAADSGAPVLLQKGAIAETLRQMARAACGKPPEPGKRKGGLFT